MLRSHRERAPTAPNIANEGVNRQHEAQSDVDVACHCNDQRTDQTRSEQCKSFRPPDPARPQAETEPRKPSKSVEIGVFARMATGKKAHPCKPILAGRRFDSVPPSLSGTR